MREVTVKAFTADGVSITFKRRANASVGDLPAYLAGVNDAAVWTLSPLNVALEKVDPRVMLCSLAFTRCESFVDLSPFAVAVNFYKTRYEVRVPKHATLCTVAFKMFQVHKIRVSPRMFLGQTVLDPFLPVISLKTNERELIAVADADVCWSDDDIVVVGQPREKVTVVKAERVARTLTVRGPRGKGTIQVECTAQTTVREAAGKAASQFGYASPGAWNLRVYGRAGVGVELEVDQPVLDQCHATMQLVLAPAPTV